MTKLLSVEQYTFFKSKANPMSDTAIGNLYGMDNNAMQKFKRENDLIGKKFTPSAESPSEVRIIRERKQPEPAAAEEPKKKTWDEVADALKEAPAEKQEAAKVVVTETLEKVESEVKEPVKLLKENDIPEGGLKMMGRPEQALSYNPASDVKAVPDAPRKVEAEAEASLLLRDAEQEIADLRQVVKALKQEKEAAKCRELMREVIEDVKAERERQNKLWGHQRHDYFKWLAILAEEFGEVAQSLQKGEGWGKDSDSDDTYTELTHLAGVAVAFAEHVKEASQNG